MTRRLAMLKRAGEHTGWLRRLTHSVAQPPPFSFAIPLSSAAPAAVLPEIDRLSQIEFEFPNGDFLGLSMELMAVPKKKTSPHKRGIRNGPKALKPVPVIVRCKACGRVKLPHFYCCNGIREHTGEQNN